MGIEHVRSEIEHMRVQVGRQRKEILQLQRAGIGTASAELLLQRMLAKIEGLCDRGTGSRRRRAVQRKDACLAAGAGDGSAMVRRERGQPALDQGAC